jgi:Flp pilus assembly pilin Flp
MKKLKDCRGSTAVEFVVAFVLISACLFIVIKFIFFAIGGELMTYGSYMASRTIKVNPYADVKKVIHRYVPWVAYDDIEFGVENIKLIIDVPVSRACEDNPIWYLKGEDPCEKN